MDANTDQPAISYSILEQYVGVYEVKTPQKNILIKIAVEEQDLYAFFSGIKGLGKEKLVFISKAEEVFGHAESYQLESDPNCTVMFLTMNYKDSQTNHSLIITWPEKQIIATKA